GIFVRTEGAFAESATLGLTITAENNGDEDNPRLEYATEIFEADSQGNRVGSAVASFAPVVGEFAVSGSTRERLSTVRTKATLANPKFWSLQTPNRYVAVTTAACNGRVV